MPIPSIIFVPSPSTSDDCYDTTLGFGDLSICGLDAVSEHTSRLTSSKSGSDLTRWEDVGSSSNLVLSPGDSLRSLKTDRTNSPKLFPPRRPLRRSARHRSEPFLVGKWKDLDSCNLDRKSSKSNRQPQRVPSDSTRKEAVLALLSGSRPLETL